MGVKEVGSQHQGKKVFFLSVLFLFLLLLNDFGKGTETDSG